MPTFVIGGIRSLIQAGWVLLARWCAGWLGVELPDDVPPWLDAMIVSFAVGAWVTVTQWLETRDRDTALGRLARRIARIYMLGWSRRPTYGASDYVRRLPR